MSIVKPQLKPRINFYELEYCLGNSNEKLVESTAIYQQVKKLTAMAFPTHQDQYDKRWEGFYLLVKRDGRAIALPLGIMEYRKAFYVSLHKTGSMHIKKGSKKSERVYKTIFSEVPRLVPFIKADEKILERLIPYDVRTGKIQGRYLLEHLLPTEEKKEALQKYERHLEKNMRIERVSLNDYLTVASVCYGAAFPKEAKSLSKSEMYKKWADGRDGGMLSIKDWDSKAAFAEWFHSGRHAGSHPFEIVFSWHEHGIHLYPPYPESPHYRLRVTNYSYAPAFIKMAKALVKENVPFEAAEIYDVLNYLAGETYFTVNDYDKHSFFYMPSAEHKKRYFRHVKWDTISIPLWKK